jgi:FKBP-type peptidyl-prolyl cis-trans isomerase (trigger factor)
MKILKFKKIKKNISEIKLQIDADELADEYKSVLDDLMTDTEIPGFRPGKAPRARVERQVGPDEIWRMARDGAAYDAFDKALEEKELSFSDEPDFEHTDYDGEGDYEVTVTFSPEPLSDDDSADGEKDRSSDKKGSDDHKTRLAKERKKRIRQRPDTGYSKPPPTQNIKGKTIKSSKKPAN